MEGPRMPHAGDTDHDGAPHHPLSTHELGHILEGDFRSDHQAWLAGVFEGGGHGDIAGVQVRLVQHGYNPGPITSEWNEQTARALARFQTDEHHESPGDLDDRTRSWLNKALI